jgi:hypothetical protein
MCWRQRLGISGIRPSCPILASVLLPCFGPRSLIAVDFTSGRGELTQPDFRAVPAALWLLFLNRDFVQPYL